LTPAERKTYTHTKLILPVSQYNVPLSNKSEREFWKTVAKENLPIRRLPKDHTWGKDKTGREIGTYKLEELKQRQIKQAKLSALNLLHRQFLTKRQQDSDKVTQEDIDTEKKRRREMAALKKDLYGEFTGLLAKDPLWDDVIPIPQNETEGALAQIAYPEDYAEGQSTRRTTRLL
jgi:protein farnesyltransferase/geranylgeranyltransferase type-1 subunit alpha